MTAPRGDHPRFPWGMPRGIQELVADQVRTTLAAYPERNPHADLDRAITAYAEQLEEFDLEDIQKGFRAARVMATVFAPTPSQVRACVAEVWRTRQELPTPEQEFVLGEFPSELREFYQQRLDAPPAHAGMEGR